MTFIPSTLVSYHYYDGVKSALDYYDFRDWALDSGAFSAASSGVPINLEAYIEFCREVLRGSNPPAEIFALDVIGDGDATYSNVSKMWDAGIAAIPAFHPGEPERLLLRYARSFPKIALGGVARLRGHARSRWLSGCFSKVWPARIHGFGLASEDHVLGLPFHSTDAASWEIQPCGFGSWRSYEGAMLSPRGKADLTPEVEWYGDLERRARARWRKQMEELGEGRHESPVVRLALTTGRNGRHDLCFKPRTQTWEDTE